MRASSVFRSLALVAIVVAGALWWHERANAAELSGRLAALRQQEQRLPGLRAERDRLHEELRAAEAQTSSAAAPPADPEPPRAEVPVAFGVEEWTPAAAWRNEGQSTPQTTIATLLWAAACGDLAAMQTVLEFDDVTRAKARAWFDGLPPATRALFATPEDLVASVTSRGIPPTAAQLNWFHQTDAEHAIVGVMMTAPVSAIPGTAPIVQPAEAYARRMLELDQAEKIVGPLSHVVPSAVPTYDPLKANRLAVLNLHRSANGWRVVVPVAAIDRMAKVLSAPAAK